MKSLYELITQSRFTRREIDESILDDDDTVKDIENSIIITIRENLKKCDDIKEFSKLWSALGLDIKGCHWGQYAGRDSYVYANDRTRFLIYCTKHMIVIYNDEPGLWYNYNNKQFKDYCNKVADVLKMKMYKNRTQKGDEYILQF